MKLTMIDIENWRGIDTISLDKLDRTLMLVGPNGAGKSSLLTALQFLLFDRCFDSEGKRIELADLVRKGKRFARVCARFEHQIPKLQDRPYTYEASVVIDVTGGKPKTERDFKLVADGKAGSVTYKHGPWTMFDLPKERAEVVGNPKAFLFSKELRQMLAGMAAPELDEKVLLAYCGENADWFDEAAQYYGMGFPKTIHDLEAFGQLVFDDRRNTKKKIAELKAQAKSKAEGAKKRKGPLTPDGKELTVENIPAVREQLGVLDGLLFDLQQERGRSEAASRVETKRDPEVLKKSLAAAEKALKKAKAAYSDAATAWKKAGDELQEIQERGSAYRANMAMAGGKPLAFGDVCSKCGQKVSAKAAERIKQEFLDGQLSLDKITIEAMDKKKEMGALEETLDEAREAYGEESGTVATMEAALKEAEKASPEEPTRPLKDIEADIKNAQEKRNRGHEILETLVAIEAAADVSDGDAVIEAATVELAYLEWAVKAFKDGEFVRMHCGDELGDFTSRVNAFLANFSLGIVFDMTEQVTYLGKSDDALVPIAQCSKGEQCLAQCAVALAFQLPVPVVIDDLDGLSVENKGKLVSLLSTCEADTVVLAAAWGLPNKVEPKAMAGAIGRARVAWLEGGVATEEG